MREYKVVDFPLYYYPNEVEVILNEYAVAGWELHTITSNGNEGILVLSKNGASIPDYKNMKPDVYGQYTAVGQYGDH